MVAYNDSYAPEKLRNLRILALRKITVKVDPAFATLTINVPPSRLTATLDDGHAFRASYGRKWATPIADSIVTDTGARR